MQHALHGRPVVPPSVRGLQRLPERHHAEREEPAELRAVPPEVTRTARAHRAPLRGAASTCCFFLCPSRDDGLNGSQAHIALNDHASLFHETKEQLDGSVTPPDLAELLRSLVSTTSPLPPCLESDSDSDLSLEDDQSGSYASTHSSDSEDEEGPLAPDECWENLASNSGKRPHAQGRDARVVSSDVGHGSHSDICLTTGCSVPQIKKVEMASSPVQTERSPTSKTARIQVSATTLACFQTAGRRTA